MLGRGALGVYAVGDLPTPNGGCLEAVNFTLDNMTLAALMFGDGEIAGTGFTLDVLALTGSIVSPNVPARGFARVGRSRHGLAGRR